MCTHQSCERQKRTANNNVLKVTHLKKDRLSKYIKPLAKLTNAHGHCALDITEAQIEYRSLKTVATVWKRLTAESRSQRWHR